MSAVVKKGTHVCFRWTDSGGFMHRGQGVVLTDEEDGHVLVAQEPEGDDARHFVIHCAVTWLTPLP